VAVAVPGPARGSYYEMVQRQAQSQGAVDEPVLR